MSISMGVVIAASISAAMFVGSIVIAYWMITRMPVNYLNDDPSIRPERPLWAGAPLFVVRNLTGLAMVVSGIVMLFTPGQGLLFILLGVALLDIPGKHRILQKLLAAPRIFDSLNRIRMRAGKPPLAPPKPSPEQASA